MGRFARGALGEFYRGLVGRGQKALIAEASFAAFGDDDPLLMSEDLVDEAA